MPELPEVQTVAAGLNTVIRGKTIAKVWSDWPKKVLPSFNSFQKQAVSNKVKKVSRRAKVIIIELSGDSYILIHLKMTGQLIFRPKTKKAELTFGGHPHPGSLDNLPNAFTHHSIEFKDGSTLFFNDVRKFGWMKLATKQEVELLIKNSAPEPGDSHFTFKEFQSMLSRYPLRKIKQLLLDQKVIAGLGNIYVDETLFSSGILPTRQVKKITVTEQKKLYQNIKKIIKKAIEVGGTSTHTYVGHDGQPGGYAKYLKVYQRTGKQCLKCKKNTIKRITLNGRGTHFCRNCQS